MISNKQKELDILKWQRSEELGVDACGTFEYCSKCSKNNENPCDKAFSEYYNTTYNTPVTEKKVAKKTTTKKTATKSTAKKTTTKKATSKTTSKKTTKSTKASK